MILRLLTAAWGNTGICDILIHLPAGDYTIVMQAYGYETDEALYWENVWFRITGLYYMQNPNLVSPDDTISAHGWTAVFEHEGDRYSSITYTHEDGRIIHSFLSKNSPTPFVLTFSPGGTRVAVEYMNGSDPAFYVQALNGDNLMEPNYDYNEYLNRYFGQYKAGTLAWVDENNIEGGNEFGRFRFNIYAFEVTQLDAVTAGRQRLGHGGNRYRILRGESNGADEPERPDRRAGGFTNGGLNFDAKTRRGSYDYVDMAHAYIGGMDAFALGLRRAVAILEDGRQEYQENIINQILFH